MKKVYVITGAIVVENEKAIDAMSIGVCSSFKKALKFVRDLAGKEYYEGEYSELIDGKTAWCRYHETKDYYGTLFCIDEHKIDELDEHIFL